MTRLLGEPLYFPFREVSPNRRQDLGGPILFCLSCRNHLSDRDKLRRAMCRK